jgi:uncharacterized protein
VHIQFEWDDAKALANRGKHGVTFEEATTAFQDPFLITFFDEDHSDYEDRLISIGLSERQRLLLIIHTDRSGIIRIISTRLTTRKEREIYEYQS